MRKITWTRIGLVVVPLNIIVSLIIRNWIASLAWFSAFCFVMALYKKEKDEEKNEKTNVIIK